LLNIYNQSVSFRGKRVLSLESRRAPEMAELIRKQGGDPFVAPSMREIPVPEDSAVIAFAERLLAGEFDMIILLTGVGTRQLDRWMTARYPPGAFANALRRLTVVARGPKPAAVLRELGVAPALIAGEPNTWREVLAVTEARAERRVAVQEYGRPNPELVDALRARGAEVSTVRIYQWDLPEDANPLREAARKLAAGDFDVVLFTTGVQIAHLARVAREQGIEAEVLEGLRRAFVASIGPTTTEALEEYGVQPDFEPSHPKMGFLVKEAAGHPNL
jgi:uroporphyrinogen-III synthase